MHQCVYRQHLQHGTYPLHLFVRQITICCCTVSPRHLSWSFVMPKPISLCYLPNKINRVINWKWKDININVYAFCFSKEDGKSARHVNYETHSFQLLFFCHFFSVYKLKQIETGAHVVFFLHSSHHSFLPLCSYCCRWFATAGRAAKQHNRLPLSNCDIR